jgi:hypothetical protein
VLERAKIERAPLPAVKNGLSNDMGRHEKSSLVPRGDRGQTAPRSALKSSKTSLMQDSTVSSATVAPNARLTAKRPAPNDAEDAVALRIQRSEQVGGAEKRQRTGDQQHDLAGDTTSRPNLGAPIRQSTIRAAKVCNCAFLSMSSRLTSIRTYKANLYLQTDTQTCLLPHTPHHTYFKPLGRFLKSRESHCIP